MLAATRSMILGLIIGGPIALIGFFIVWASFWKTFPYLITFEQRKAFLRTPKCVAGIVCMFVGLIIMLLGVLPVLFA